MNRKQRVCLIVGFLLLVAATLFPPWRIPGGRTFGLYLGPSSSYGFLFNPPSGGANLELSRLLVEWVLIALLTLGLVYLLRQSSFSKRERRTESASGTPRRVFSLSFAMYVLIAALAAASYVSLRKVRRLEAGIQNARKILGPPPRFIFLGPCAPEDSVPVGLAPVGTVNGVPVYTDKQTNQMVQAEYDRVVDTMQKVVERKDETLDRVREALDKLN